MSDIQHRLIEFKRRFHQKELYQGTILFLIVSISAFFLISWLEYHLWLRPLGRATLFFSFVFLVVFLLAKLIISPARKLLNPKHSLSDDAAADLIERSFPEIADKLKNTIQLGKTSSESDGLLEAAIQQKSKQLSALNFIEAVDYQVVKRFLMGFGGLLVCVSLLSFVHPNLIKDGTTRIVKYNEEFVRKAPFEFDIINASLSAFSGEDFTLNVKLSGSELPEDVFLTDGNGMKLQLQHVDSLFRYTFSNLIQEKTFQLEAAGYLSKTYTIEIENRPELASLNILVIPPAYTKARRETITNTGNLIVPEGSTVDWLVKGQHISHVDFMFGTEKETADNKDGGYQLSKTLSKSSRYQIELSNQAHQNKDDISYQVEVIKDKHPEITVEYLFDTLNYEFLTVTGQISDDYGFSKLQLVTKGENTKTYPIQYAKGSLNSSFITTYAIEALGVGLGEKLTLYVEVSDNDQINGAKSKQSRPYTLNLPDKSELNKQIDQQSDELEKELASSAKKAESLTKELEELEKRLKTEQQVSWQEEKMLENIMKQKSQQNEQIRNLQQEHQQLNKSQEQFQEQSQSLQEKNQKLQELMQELMDEQTMELYEKLQELMQERQSPKQVQEQLNKIKQNEKHLEKELERALELFKRLKLEASLEENRQKLDSLSAEQKELSEQQGKQERSEEEAQESIKEDFEDFREQMDEIREMNQDLKRPEPLQDFQMEEKQIQKLLEEIAKEMEAEKKKEEENNSPDSPEKQEPKGGQPDEQSEGDQSQSEKSNEQQEGDGQEKQNNAQEGKQDKQGSENQQKSEGDQNQQGQQGGGDQKQGQKQEPQQSSNKQRQEKQKEAAEQMKSLSDKMSQMQSSMQMEMMQANLDQLRDIIDNLIKLSFDEESIMTELKTVNQSDPRFLELSQYQLKLKDDAKVVQDSLMSLASKVIQISSFVTKEVAAINQHIDQSLEDLRNRNRNKALASQQFAMTSMNNLALLLGDVMDQMQMAMSESMGSSGSSQKQSSSPSLSELQDMQQQLSEQMKNLQGSGKKGRELSEELARMAAEQEMIRQQMEQIKEGNEGKPGGGSQNGDLQRAIQMMEQNEIDLVNKRITRQLITRQKQIETRLLEAKKAEREQSEEEQREAQKASEINRTIPPQFEEYIKLKQKEIELLKTIPLELNPFYKKEVNDYFRRISAGETDD